MAGILDFYGYDSGTNDMVSQKQQLLSNQAKIDGVQNEKIEELESRQCSGAVISVNGKIGNVILDADDIGAATAEQGMKADTAYQKPSNGIPTSDLASGVQSSLTKADTAYQKSSNGIPKTDLASGVQTSLGKADAAYQKPSNGIPATDLASGVQTSLGKADTAIQEVKTINGNSIVGTGDINITSQTYVIDNTPTYDSNNLVTSGGVQKELALGAVWDVSEHNSLCGTTFESLSVILNSPNLDALIPTDVRKGGMQIKFVQSIDNNYVQWRLVSTTFSTDPNDWVAENEDFRNEVMQEVNEAIASINPIEITGDVTNAPDEHDLTSVNIEGTDVLRFKNKDYAPLIYSGMGRTYLRKNLVNGVNVITQDMFYKGEVGSRVPNTNTIFLIQYDYDLNGQTINIPDDCVLKFDGGSLRNGTINVGNAVFIEAPCNKIFYNLTISGNIANNSAPLNWWCSSSSSADVTDDLSSAFLTSVREFVVNGIYAISSPVKLPSNAVIKGQGPSNFKRYGFKALPTFSEKTINDPRIQGTSHVVHGMFYHYYDYKPIIKDIFINADFHAKFCIEHVAGYSWCNIYSSTLENAKFACIVQYGCEQPIVNELVCLSSHIGFYSSTKRLLDGDITSSSGGSAGQNNLIQMTQCYFANCNYGAVVEGSSNISLHSCKFAQNSIFALILRKTNAYISDIYSERDGNCGFWINPDTGEKTTAQSGQTLAYLYEENHTIGGVTTSGRLDGITPGLDFKFSPSSNGEKAYYRAPIYIKSSFLNIESAYISYQNRGFQGTILPPSPDTKTEAGVDSIMLIELSVVQLNNVVQFNHNNGSLSSLYAYIIDLTSSEQSQTLSYIHSSGNKGVGPNLNNKIYVTAPHGSFHQLYNKLGSENNTWNYFIEGFSSNDYNFNIEDRIRGAGYDTNRYRYNFKQNIFRGFIKNAPLYKIIHHAGGLDGLYINKDDIASFFGKREQIKIVFFAKVLNDIDSILVRFDFYYGTTLYTFPVGRQVYCSLTNAKAGEVYKFKQIVFLKPPISANIEDSWKYLYLHNYLSVDTTDVVISDIFMYDVEDGEELIPSYQSVYMPSGTTAIRPDASNVAIGTHYFDTDLGKDLVSNGTAWVDATGATV